MMYPPNGYGYGSVGVSAGAYGVGSHTPAKLTVTIMVEGKINRTASGACEKFAFDRGQKIADVKQTLQKKYQVNSDDIEIVLYGGITGARSIPADEDLIPENSMLGAVLAKKGG